MGRLKEHPRYNILSCRVSDATKQSVTHALGGRSVQQFIHEAVEEKLISDRQARIDKVVSRTKRAMR